MGRVPCLYALFAERHVPIMSERPDTEGSELYSRDASNCRIYPDIPIEGTCLSANGNGA